MNTLLVSIIIPVYKVEPYIERCINSVLRQTYRHLEVILVDDCSQDKSIEIAKAVINDYQKENGNDNVNDNLNHNDISFVFLRHEHNRGLSAARNTGIDAATGDYLYFLDSDDEITSDCIEKLVREAEEGGYDAVCGYFKIEGHVSNYWKKYQHLELKSYDRDEILRNYTSEHLYMMACNKLVKRETINSKSLYFKEGIMHEDVLWSLLLANHVASMRVISNITYIYWMRANSISTAISKIKSYDSTIVILKESQKLLQNGIIRDVPDNHKYLMYLRKQWMTRIFNSDELSRMGKMRYLLSIAHLQHGFSFSVHFLFSRCWQKIKNIL